MNLDVPIKQKVSAAIGMMKAMPQVELPIRHYFSEGVYAREITIPAGVTLAGKIHKFSQLNILSKGVISVLIGDEIKTIEAPFTIVSPPGTERIAFAHTDCIWTTVHGTNETDLEKIEEKFIAQDEQEYIEFCRKQLEKQ